MATERTSSSTYVALLRGINVGGRNRLPMGDLKRMFKDAGCLSVRTYIQSGNVIFVSTPSGSQMARETVAAAVFEAMGTRIPIILRSIHELTQVVGQNPFLSESQDSRTLHVGFLADRPSSRLVVWRQLEFITRCLISGCYPLASQRCYRLSSEVCSSSNL